MFNERGLFQIYTGNGKGKTTAALGIAMRAAGHGARVLIIQFMKGWCGYGELRTIEKLPEITLIQTGRPDYIYRGRETAEDYSEAERGLAAARNALKTGGCDMLILDELNVALDYGLVKLPDVVELVMEKPEDVELIITGRNAPKKLMEKADLITEMHLVRHPYDNGITARKGVEF